MCVWGCGAGAPDVSAVVEDVDGSAGGDAAAEESFWSMRIDEEKLRAFPRT